MATIVRRISAIKNYLLFLSQSNLYSHPLPKVDLPKQDPICPSFYRQKKQIVCQMPLTLSTSESIAIKQCWEVMYACGLRVSELLSLTRNQINFQNDTIRIIGKGNKERIIPIGEFALGYLTKYIEEVRATNPGYKSNYIFLNRMGKRCRDNTFIKRLMNMLSEQIQANEYRHILFVIALPLIYQRMERPCGWYKKCLVIVQLQQRKSTLMYQVEE